MRERGGSDQRREDRCADIAENRHAPTPLPRYFPPAVSLLSTVPGDIHRVIMMATMSVEDTISLSEDEFAMYVMDQWRWKQAFAETTLRYLR